MKLEIQRSSLTCLLLLCCSLCCAAVNAQDTLEEATNAVRTNPWYQGSHAPERKATQACGTPTETSSYPAAIRGPNDDANSPWPTETTVFAVKSWSGGCENGQRSGHGTIVTRSDVSTTSEGSRRTSKIIKAEGTYVAGLPQGLWCVLDYQALADGAPDEWDISREVGCRLVISHPWDGVSSSMYSPYYRRLDDGRWQQMDSNNNPVVPEVYLPPGSIEAESARLISEAHAGHANVDFKQMDVQTSLLDGLVAGTHISPGTPISLGSLKGKCVALVLSSRMLAELERFNRERQALLDASAGFTGRALAERNRFESASKQERLIQAMADALRRRAGEVTAVDDLSGLVSGKYDYAYVLDWQSLSHLDLLGKFKTTRVKAPGDPPGQNYVAGQALGGFLISPDMKLVATSVSAGEFGYKFGDCTDSRRDHGCDADYLKLLADFYQSAWETGDRRSIY